MADSLDSATIAMDGGAIDQALSLMAQEIVDRNSGSAGVALVGIVTRGDVLARRLAAILRDSFDVQAFMGSLDISFYRDDYATYLSPELHSTDILFDLDGLDVVLVDDVLYTGRTVRAALDALLDIGRPKTVQLAVLVDRGNREMPISSDFTGMRITSSSNQNVRVYLHETDGLDAVEVSDVEPGMRPGSAPLKGGADGISS